MHREACEECGADNFVIDWRQGDRICTECGIISDSHMMSDQPWGQFNDSESCVPEAQGTSLAFGKGSSHRKCTADGSFRMIEVLQKGLTSTSKVNTAFLEEVCRFVLKVPTRIIDSAKELVEKVSQVEQQSSRGKNLIGLQACSVYHACIMQGQEGVGRSIAEIVSAFDIPEPTFTKANHRLKTALEGTKYHKSLFETNKSSDLVDRSIALLSIASSKATKNAIRRKTLKILDDFEKKKLLQERTSSSVAAVAIYMAVSDVGHKMPMSKFTKEVGLIGQATLSMILKQLKRVNWELDP